jgi:hypothetical protein
MLLVPLGEHEFLVRVEHGKLADFLKVAVKSAFRTQDR